MRKNFFGLFAPVGLVLVFAACSDGEGSSAGGSGGTGGTAASGGSGGSAGSGGGTSCTVTPGSAWSAPNWDANTEAALGLRQRLGALTGDALMHATETGAVTTTDLSALTTAYETGTPSLKSATSTYFDGLMADAFEEFLAAVGAGAQDLVDTGGNWAPGAEGGIWSTSTRAFNEGGLEIRQIVDKGLFGAGALYNYALGLTAGTIDEATIDALAAAFGANPALNPGRNDAAVVTDQNQHSANYVYRMGFYGSAKQALIDAKAYLADTNCTAERDAAIQGFFRAWEQGLFARFVFYSNSGATKVGAATDDDGLAGALHDQAEGLGLAIGFYGIANPASGPMSAGARVMTDQSIAEALQHLGVNVTADLGDATLGAFAADPLGYTTAVSAAEDVIAEAFNLTETDLESYRVPTDG